MFVEFYELGDNGKDQLVKTIGPFKKIDLNGADLVCDGQSYAYFNRDESYWMAYKAGQLSLEPSYRLSLRML